MKKAKFILLLLFFGLISNAKASDSTKVNTLNQFLKKGKFSIQSRAYFMQTNNKSPLTDYYSFASGGGITYRTPTFKGFSAGMSGYFIFNLASSNLTVVDSITHSPNRYELGLFDVTDPTNKTNLTKLEDLWVKYENKGVMLKYGHFVPTNLFINAQDGRMRPTYVNGLWSEYAHKKLNIVFAFINQISPRSTIKWYSVEESFGIYPMGKAVNGKASEYKGNVSTSGIIISEVNVKPANNFTLKIGNISVPSVFQTTYLNPVFVNKKLYLGALGLFQTALKDGGNAEMQKTYFEKGGKALAFSTRIGVWYKKNELNLNYTRITKDGRYLMPREWGRDPFYTFIPRERNEGLGDVHAATVNYWHTFSKQTKANFAFGTYWLPTATDARLNKYAMPSYTQWLVQADYSCKNWLEGLTIKGLFTYKGKLKNEDLSEKFVFNKVQMSILNIILNYTINQ